MLKVKKDKAYRVEVKLPSPIDEYAKFLYKER